MANRTVQHEAKIDARQWSELKRDVDFVARTFHCENKARYAIFAMLRRRFGVKASALRAVDFPAALKEINDVGKRANAFMYLRYRFEEAAIRRIFGSEAANVSEEELATAIGQLSEPIDEHQLQSDVIDERPDLRTTPSNVVQFPARKSLSAQIAASPLRELWTTLREKGYVAPADKMRDVDEFYLSMGIEDDTK